MARDPIEAMTTQEFSDHLAREIAKLRFMESAKARVDALLQLEKDQATAERARDQAVKDRDVALAEIATAKEKYDREREAALADVARVIKERSEMAARERGQAEHELTALKAQTQQARDAKTLAEGQRDAFKAEAEREVTAIKTWLEAVRAEERAAKERLGSVAAALKG